MRGEPVGGDVDHLARQPRRDHPPADRALNPAEDPEPQKPGGPAPGDPFHQGEPHEAREPDQADETAKLAMAPFPPVDDLELGQRHVRVHKLKLGNGLVFLEFAVPGLR